MWKFSSLWDAESQTPWYRKSTYRGDLAEADKRELDSFRLIDQHPSKTTEDIPKEVLDFIYCLKIENDELRNSSFTERLFLFTVLVLALFYGHYNETVISLSFFQVIVLVGILILAWFLSWVREKKNQSKNEFSLGSSYSTNELIKEQWELNYISEKRSQQNKQSE